jgi:phenol 2-monooxygenase
MTPTQTPPGTSYYRHLLLAQGRVEQLLMDCAEEACTSFFFAEFPKPSIPVALSHQHPHRKTAGLKVERNTIPTAYSKSTDSTSSHPITVTLSRLASTKPPTEADLKSGLYRSNMFAPSEAPTAPTDGQGRDANVVAKEDVRCRYLVGCDGARSWVRKELGLKLEGDSANTYVRFPSLFFWVASCGRPGLELEKGETDPVPAPCEQWGVVDAKALTDVGPPLVFLIQPQDRG